MSTATDTIELVKLLEPKIGEQAATRLLDYTDRQSASLTGDLATKDLVKQEIDKAKAELKAEIGEVKAELKAEIAGVNGRVDGLSGRVDGLSGQVDRLSGRMDGLRLALYILAGAVAILAGVMTYLHSDTKADVKENQKLLIQILQNQKK